MRIALQLASLLALAVAAGGWSSCKDSSAVAPEPASSGAEAQPEVKDVTLPGVDTSAMTPRERREFSSLVTDLLAPCPNVPVSIAQCVEEKRPCAPCAQAAKWIARAVREGAGESQIQAAFKERYDPTAVKAIPLAGSPSRGPDDAKVTVVEFADFECPHCRMAVPMVDAVMAAHAGKVRLVYKFVELSMHVHAEAASRAAWAAGQQGKFWEMEHLLFERQDHLEQGDLERYAKMLKLDVAKWKSDMDSQAAKDRLAEDQRLEDDLKLKGTPTIYVNGRELDLENDELLEDRVAGELGVPPVPPASASAASPAAPSTAPPAPSPAPGSSAH
ncbi:MAG TPA: thioredoxin domain-containing protein [Polyangiaceae bacterium]